MTQTEWRARPEARRRNSVSASRSTGWTAPAKTTGTALFSAEYPYPDLAHAALVHATVARGRITAIDTADASAVEGVLAVLTHETRRR